MKIMYVYRYSILGGVSTQLANRLQFFKASNLSPHFVFLKDYGGREAFGDYPNTFIANGIDHLAKLISDGNYEFIIIIDTPEAYSAIDKANYNGVIINEVHTTTSNIKYLEQLHNRKIDAFITPSQYLATRIENEFGYKDTKNTYVVHNCLDTELFRPVSINIEPNKKVIMWIGKLDEHKNWRMFLSIAQTLNTNRSDYEFWLIGGETANNDIAEELFHLVDDYNLVSNFRWIQRVEYSKMPLLYSAVAKSGGLTVSTTHNESFGMTVVESLACGCPTLAPSVGAIPEILDGELEGCLYEELDQFEAVTKVNQIINNTEYRNLIMNKGIERINNRYSIKKVGKDYVDLLQKIRK